MALTTYLAREIRSDVRQRGRPYFTGGSVHILHGDAQAVEATVQGTQMYEVSLARAKKAVKVFCSCPYFLDHEDACKHVWATLLAAEGRGYLLGSDGTDPRRLDIDLKRLDEWDDSGEWNGPEPEDWDDEDDVYPGEEILPYRGYQPTPPRPRAPKTSSRPAKRKPKPPDWKKSLAGLKRGMQPEEIYHGTAWPPGREILYVVDAEASQAAKALVVEVAYRERKKDGDWSKPKSKRIDLNQIAKLPDPADREILGLLVGAREHTNYWGSYGYSYYDSASTRYQLSQPQQEALLPRMCQAGRCLLRRSPDEPEPRLVRWDDGLPWEFRLEIVPDEAAKHYLGRGVLRRGEERLALSAPVLLVPGGLVFWDDRVARLDDLGAFDWVPLLRSRGDLKVPVQQKEELLAELLNFHHLPRLDLPEEMRYEEVRQPPQAYLKVKAPEHRSWGFDRLRGELSFDYGGVVVPAEKSGRGVYQSDQRRYLLRDLGAEAEAADRLRQLGFRTVGYYGGKDLELAPRNLPKVVRTLLDAGWRVEAQGKLYRQPGNFHIEVSSGIDWFELHGSVDFGDTTAQLPELLAALKRGEDTVKLGDGTYGVLPEEWLKKYGLLAGLGTAQDGHLRFTRCQVGLLDALLASQPEATCDAVFARARDELQNFEGVTAADPPAGFVGELRGYQREGLGWLSFLQKFGFGGCLADDMGLGKTVQVLALLESRRELRARGEGERPGPSLVVVPRSLVFNWKQEAARFTPNLKVLDHTGIARAKAGEHFHDYDVVLTTYGTLRRDALAFKDLRFDYCILDEAQAVKNASSESAKAVRLLQGNHRLALSGTPVENHLGELWSLFEFLNPGMLGSASVFRLGGAGARNPSEDTRTLLARALRPFILRRTKVQVAKDLPQKLEQTMYCELEPPQRKRYNELRQHYRQVLLDKVARDGLAKSKIQILEALLRLRQAACHPGLIDKARADEGSAKLDMLLPQLDEVTDEGHKALVFSQFTSLLAIVRERLDKAGVRYEYLDGRTRDRAARVERFQNDPDCKLFLVSLKAGGLGLNLTAAEYVFLLDPWWNPAVEAQAIDRAHRIGQTRQVFAYRLIARDTVEEKVLELQKTKRDLADAIINADNSLIRDLGREDLELLLS
jgi:hypothetical protein